MIWVPSQRGGGSRDDRARAQEGGEMLLQSPEIRWFQSLPLPPAPSLPSKAPPRASSSRLRSERSFLWPLRPKTKDMGSSDPLPASRWASGGAADKPVRPRPRCCEERPLSKRLAGGSAGEKAGWGLAGTGGLWPVACDLPAWPLGPHPTVRGPKGSLSDKHLVK